MKARIIKTGEIVEVVDRTDTQVTVYRNDETEFFAQNVYNIDEVELDFKDELTEIVTIDGWIVRDKFKSEHSSSDLYFSGSLPMRNKSCGDWYNMRPHMALPTELYPNVTWDTPPFRVQLTLTPIQ